MIKKGLNIQVSKNEASEIAKKYTKPLKKKDMFG